MRFLFVYETAAGKVRDLLAELLVQDHVIVDSAGANSALDLRIRLSSSNTAAQKRRCMRTEPQVPQERPGVRDVHGRTQEVPGGGPTAADWLTRRDPADERGHGCREERSRHMASRQKHGVPRCSHIPFVVLCSGALDTANRLDESRWAFAAKSADLLRNHADGGSDLGPFREWQANHGVAFAANGRVEYRYRASTRTDRYNRPSQWHLKAGDRTSPELAARIYFTVAELDGRSIVLVAHVGPHPSDGSYSADFGEIELAT
ncbi:MAG: hypothetical protein H6515_12670 [Microthrixaceae bacterium]|nr:hypothetical protein [Microthrixaceae bacterium]